MDIPTFFQENPKAALGFSGGVDSSYLLYAGIHSGAKIKAYYVSSEFQPQFEKADAVRMADQLGAEITIIDADILSVPNVAENPSDRCYYCKSAIFSIIKKAARNDGFSLLIDGTNASDETADRPGMRALTELEVQSPLRECGISKSEVRRLSKEAGLFTWNKPAYACLATRIPGGTYITAGDLGRVERAEDSLRALGFSDFRVRLSGSSARLELPASQISRAQCMKVEIDELLHQEFETIVLDPAGRKMEETVI
jgi:uncharacterized protein